MARSVAGLGWELLSGPLKSAEIRKSDSFSSIWLALADDGANLEGLRGAGGGMLSMAKCSSNRWQHCKSGIIPHTIFADRLTE